MAGSVPDDDPDLLDELPGDRPRPAGSAPGRGAACGEALLTAEALRAEQEALAIAVHEGPVQNFTMLGIRLEQARARLARGEVAETERALSHLQVALADEISTLRRMLTARHYQVS